MDMKHVVRDNTKALDEILKELGSHQVLIGIPAETAERDGGPISNAAIGYILETGAPEQNLPARPFLHPGVASARDDIAKVARNTLVQALALRGSTSESARAIQNGLAQMGLVAANAVCRRIDTGDFAPLAPSTIYRRQRRANAPRSGEKPLVDSGQLRSAVTYVVRKA